MAGLAAAESAGTMVINIHDGIPWTPNLDTGAPHWASGNFMNGFPDVLEAGFAVERVWFYHGGQYFESGEPYEVYFFARYRYNGIDDFTHMLTRNLTTTCNYCWEEFSLGWNWWPGLPGENYSLGIFVLPLGGTAASPAPMLWRDRYANTSQLAAIMEIDEHYPPPYQIYYYYSDYGMGEVLLGMEISSDVIVGAETTSFSAVKSLY